MSKKKTIGIKLSFQIYITSKIIKMIHEIIFINEKNLNCNILKY
jgi:hypothetical protein